MVEPSQSMWGGTDLSALVANLVLSRGMLRAGSVDEDKDEQGIAHLVEHVTFLGSSKREGLLGTGARSNAYTDFHHTVFHVHAPLVNTSFGEPSPMLPQVDAPSFLATPSGLSQA